MDGRRRVRGSGARAIACLVSLASLTAPLARAQQKPTAAASAQATFDDLYRRGQKANAGITTLTARFTETTTTALLKQPLVYRGVLYVQRPTRRVAMHYSDPAGRLVLIDGDRMINSWPALRILDRRDIGATQKRIQRYFEDDDPGELRKVFDIQLHDTSERPGMREVTLLPKRRQIQEALTRLDLWVDESSSLMNAMRMTFANGDTKLMEFSNVMPNTAIEPAMFNGPK